MSGSQKEVLQYSRICQTPACHPGIAGGLPRGNYIYEDQALPPEGADYPGSYEGLCLIRDKGLLVRPVKVTDERAVQNLFYAMSRDDRFHRFLMHV
ncbi:MAG: hypothetical protein RBT82_13725, partial [Desulfomonilia bacterium]|nr:hypothetical protein [Desulfomonilia bacterium]